ncbi:MAG: kdpE [Armatimonadetes bacterium]|jgi:two-component system KDP operon response regulator KdpE|nr:kdpE [Armatimonadota bacterium]
MSSTRILVVDDEPQIGRMLRTQLTARGYQVEHVSTGNDGLLAVGEQPPDLVLLDLGLPDMDGIEVARRIREWSAVPIIFLTVRDEERTKVQALDVGGDDYVTKPFGIPELLARVRAVLRRKQEQPATAGPVFASGELRVDFAARQVSLAGQEVRLTPTEYELLRLFVLHADKTLTHRQLLTQIWGPEATTETQYLHVFIRQLRRKLEPDPSKPRHFMTEPGVGYRFRTQPTSVVS